MTEVAIRVDGLGKWYQIGSREQYHTLRDSLANLVSAPARAASRSFARRDHDGVAASSPRIAGPFQDRHVDGPTMTRLDSAESSPRIAGSSHGRTGKSSMWALRDVSFEVKRGEVLGIIGRNGAGKSTLLKILSRITDPTRGRAEMYGRVGSLLEVGTGFHPELTGRENIYLNGAILGMKKAEIDRGFDEIVEFAGIEEFLDTPVKRYSSGMHMRLAFSVAAHLQTEILLVDEVLAVGDAVFQLRCLNKMSEVSGSGRTILFVSHNMEAVTKLCGHGVLLEDGKVARIGTPQECVDQYLSRASRDWDGRPLSLAVHSGRTKQHNGPVRLTSLSVVDASGQATPTVVCGGQVGVVIGYELAQGVESQNVMLVVTFASVYGHRISTCRSSDSLAETLRVDRPGQAVCWIPRLPLVPGSYSLTVGCNTQAGFSDGVYDAAVLEVTGGDFYPSRSVPPRAHGEVLFEHHWEVINGVC